MYYVAYGAKGPAGKIYYIIMLFRSPSVCFILEGEREKFI